MRRDAQVGVQPRAQRAQDEAQRRAQDAHADRYREVERRLPAGDVVVDVGDAERVDGRLPHADAEQADEEDGEHDGGVLGLDAVLGLARRRVGGRRGEQRRPRVVAAGVQAQRQRRVAVGVRRAAHVGREHLDGARPAAVASEVAHARRRHAREQPVVGLDELVAEEEVRQRAGEGGDGEEHHAPGDPLGPVTLAAVVGEQKRRADLADLGGAHDDARRLGLDLEELLDGGDDADEVGVVHALQHPRDAEGDEEGLLGGEDLHPARRARPDAAAQVVARRLRLRRAVARARRQRRLVVVAHQRLGGGLEGVPVGGAVVGRRAAVGLVRLVLPEVGGAADGALERGGRVQRRQRVQPRHAAQPVAAPGRRAAPVPPSPLAHRGATAPPLLAAAAITASAASRSSLSERRRRQPSWR